LAVAVRNSADRPRERVARCYAIQSTGNYPELSTASPVASQTRLGDYFSVARNPSNSLLYDASGYAVLKQPVPATGWYFDPYYIQFGRDSVAKGGSSGIH
jgi:hypothetical protein